MGCAKQTHVCHTHSVCGSAIITLKIAEKYYNIDFTITCLQDLKKGYFYYSLDLLYFALDELIMGGRPQSAIYSEVVE